MMWRKNTFTRLSIFQRRQFHDAHLQPVSALVLAPTRFVSIFMKKEERALVMRAAANPSIHSLDRNQR